MTVASWPRRLAVVGLGAALATAGTACTRSPDQLDRAATERAVGEVAADRVDLPVTRTTCPSDIPRRRGEEVTCTVRFDHVARPLTVTVRQRDGAGRLAVSFEQAVVDPADITEDLHRALVTRFGRSFLVDCGTAGAQVVAPGHHFGCKARDRGGPNAIDVTVADVAGTLRYEIG